VLGVFDTGFVRVDPGSSFAFSHNLGTNKLIFRIYYSPDAVGSEMEEVVADSAAVRGASGWTGAFIKDITSRSFVLQSGSQGLTRSSGTTRLTGFLRVIAVAFR
jgi:hypothetical protein